VPFSEIAPCPFEILARTLRPFHYRIAESLILVPNIDQMYKEMKKIQTGNISKGQGAISEKGTFMHKHCLKKGTLMHKD
jgi:hypothetical protein